MSLYNTLYTGIIENDLRLMWHCVVRHFRDDLSISQIHEEIRIPRTKVSQLLKEAIRIGMVRIDFDPPRLLQLETGLIDRWGLRDAIVIEAGRDMSFTMRDIGRAAAPYLEGIIGKLVIDRQKQNKGKPVRISFACGRTVLEVVQALRPAYFSKANLHGVGLEIYPLNVSDTAAFAAQFPNLIVSAVKAKWSSDEVTAYNLVVKHIDRGFETEEEKLKYLKAHGIHQLFENASNADIFVIGIGAFKDINPGFREILREKGIEQHKLMQLAEGEINYQPFNARGFLSVEEVPEIHRRLISVSTLTLKKAAEQPDKYVLAVACGLEKVNAVKTSLARNNLCYNILITDDQVADALLRKG